MFARIEVWFFTVPAILVILAVGMLRLKSVSFVLLIAMTLLSTGTASAQQILYGVTYGPGSSLMTINTATGTGTLVAPLNPTIQAGGIAFRMNKLYVPDVASQNIYEINPATGATLNTINIGAPVGAFGDGDLAFRSDGIGFVSGHAPLAPLLSAEITVPSSVTIGPLSPNFTMDGLAFNAADVLYAISESAVGGSGPDITTQLYTVNQSTGNATLIGPTGVMGNSTGGLCFDSSGALFAALGSPAGSSLYRINPATGVATLIGNIGFANVSGIAFQTPPGVTVNQSGGSTNLTEGGATDTYTVVLDSAPTANVTITINAGTQVAVAPASLTFTPLNWNTAQTVIVSAVDDAFVEGPHIGIITHTSTSGDIAYNVIVIAGVTANITDNDGSAPLTHV